MIALYFYIVEEQQLPRDVFDSLETRKADSAGGNMCGYTGGIHTHGTPQTAQI